MERDGLMGNQSVSARGRDVRVVASASTWIEGEALRQLEACAELPGMVRCVGLPDLHPGKGSPVGAAFLSDGILRPSLVGSDIGCGISVWGTDLAVRKARPDKLAARMGGLDEALPPGEAAPALEAEGLPPDLGPWLGTPGRGNHFVELQRIVRVEDAAAAAAVGLDPDRVVVLVHSGSRGLGERVLRAHAAAHGADGLAALSPEGEEYLRRHDEAVRFGRVNRDACARRMLGAIGAGGARLLDSCHNSVTRAPGGWLHRKGAAPTDAGPVAIPGSRGDFTWIVAPAAGADASLWSLAHGAGRKIARGEARAKLGGRLRRQDLSRNPWGGAVVCGEEALLWEEAPGCYKDGASVVAALVEAGLCAVVAVAAPLVTFKTSAGEEPRGHGGDDWRRGRRERREAKERGWR
jgi:release factor H-coupled RctB family protein